jgi:hypothetical protein
MVSPPFGAAYESVTTPTEVEPPTTDDADKARFATVIGAKTVRTAVLAEPAVVDAEMVALVDVATARVMMEKVAPV